METIEVSRAEQPIGGAQGGNARARGGPLSAAFRELHGRRLHGFATLVTLGDSQRAAMLAGEALSAGSRRSAELRHPERAAAWLRSRVVRGGGGVDWFGRRPDDDARREALRRLGVDDIAFAGLAALNARERAALVAADIEGLDPLDVATVLSSGEAAARRLARQARSRYLRAAVAALPRGRSAELHGTRGTEPLAARVASAADRALT